MSDSPSRIGKARRRAAGVKQAAVALAAAGFLAVALLARASHPGHASSASGGSSSSVRTENDDGFSLQPGTLGQSSGSSSGAQTGVS